MLSQMDVFIEFLRVIKTFACLKSLKDLVLFDSGYFRVKPLNFCQSKHIPLNALMYQIKY